jgi:hypothetical protein
MRNQPAFPAPAGVAHITEQGMTLRDYAAIKAMQGTLAMNNGGPMSKREIAKWSYQMADEMLIAREE